MWNAQTRSLLRVDEVSDFVQAVSFSPNSQCLAYACADGNIGLFTSSFGQTLKGHNKAVWSLIGRLMVNMLPQDLLIPMCESGTAIPAGTEDPGRARRLGVERPLLSWRQVAGQQEQRRHGAAVALRYLGLRGGAAGSQPRLCARPGVSSAGTGAGDPGDNDTVIRLWHFDEDVLGRQTAVPGGRSVHYTTAKVVLVGDSGVGKTGLGFRLCHGQFKERLDARAAVLGDAAATSPARGRHAVRSGAVGSGRAAGVSAGALDLPGKRRGSAGGGRSFQPARPAQGAQFWLRAAQGQGRASASGAGRGAHRSREVRRSARPSLRSSVSATASAAATSEPARCAAMAWTSSCSGLTARSPGRR